tara:strand:+ start:177 stop:899 length:723 start_codon:yes stop_codon:yes gene_type:complete
MSTIQTLIKNNIVKKKSNICLSLDYTKTKDILNVLNLVKDYIIIVKIHVDIIEDFDNNFINSLVKICDENNILIFEDRKFADIGYIFEKQFTGGIYNINKWANLITVHSIVGDGILKIFEKCKKHNQGILYIAEMSNKNNMLNNDYKNKTLEIANKYKNCIIGFICQHKISNCDYLYFTPGVNIECTKDNYDQKYISPETAFKNGSDIIIIGRGITNSHNIKESCIKYRDIFYNLYKTKL